MTNVDFTVWHDIEVGPEGEDTEGAACVRVTDEGVTLEGWVAGEEQGHFQMGWEDLLDHLLPECVHCHTSIFDNGQALIDLATWGDICGAHGTNHPHCKGFDAWHGHESICNGCRVHKEDHR